MKQAYLKEIQQKPKCWQIVCLLVCIITQMRKNRCGEASISLLNALILAICEIGIETKQTQIINMYAVTSMLEELGAYPDEKGNTALDTFFNDLPPTSVARKQYGTIKFSQGITVVVFLQER